MPGGSELVKQVVMCVARVWHPVETVCLLRVVGLHWYGIGVSMTGADDCNWVEFDWWQKLGATMSPWARWVAGREPRLGNMAVSVGSSPAKGVSMVCRQSDSVSIGVAGGPQAGRQHGNSGSFGLAAV